jgi:hypothetical protein
MRYPQVCVPRLRIEEVPNATKAEPHAVEPVSPASPRQTRLAQRLIAKLGALPAASPRAAAKSQPKTELRRTISAPGAVAGSAHAEMHTHHRHGRGLGVGPTVEDPVEAAVVVPPQRGGAAAYTHTVRFSASTPPLPTGSASEMPVSPTVRSPTAAAKSQPGMNRRATWMAGDTAPLAAAALRAETVELCHIFDSPRGSATGLTVDRKSCRNSPWPWTDPDSESEEGQS